MLLCLLINWNLKVQYGVLISNEQYHFILSFIAYHVFFISSSNVFVLFQVWDIQPNNRLWSSGGDLFNAHIWELYLLYFLIHKSEALVK
jgi:hypothetical protein